MTFPLPQQDYTVMVVTLTYNHAPYIEDTLKGILMQQTDFPIVACVLDDCSTDGTADIVRKYEAQYPDIIKGFYFDENQYSQGKHTYTALISWLPKIKYIALCEGDDYWTDPLKLQKQVDLMEAHTDCTMCFHSVTEHWEDGSAPDKIFFSVENRAYTGTEIFKQWVVATCSVLYRTNIIQDQRFFDISNNKDLMYYDQSFYMFCSVIGNVMGISDEMGVYRRVNSGYTLQLTENKKCTPNLVWRYCIHNLTMADIFGNQLGEEFRHCAISIFVGTAMSTSIKYAKEFNLKVALFFFWKAFSYYPKETIALYWRIIKSKLKK